MRNIKYIAYHFVVLLLSWALQGEAQTGLSARHVALGGYAMAHSDDPGGLFSNPAGAAALSRPALFLSHRFYHHQPDVSAQGLALGLPMPRGVFLGLSVFQYGLSDAFSDRTASIFLGRRFGPDLRIVLGGMFRLVSIPGYLKQSDGMLQVSAQYDVASAISLGLVLGGLSLSAMRQYEQLRLGGQGIGAQLGVVYRLGEFVALNADLGLGQHEGLSLQGGLEYHLVPEWFCLRLGLSSRGMVPAAGLGVSRGRFRMDVGSDFHRSVGMSPQMDLFIIF